MDSTVPCRELRRLPCGCLRRLEWGLVCDATKGMLFPSGCSWCASENAHGVQGGSPHHDHCGRGAQNLRGPQEGQGHGIHSDLWTLQDREWVDWAHLKGQEPSVDVWVTLNSEL